MTFSSGFLSLEQFACAGSHDADAARGRCLGATIELGREALRLGVAQRVAFVRWHVHGDPEFLERWALALDDDRVLDPTAAQIDGDPTPLRRRDEHPANDVSPKRYPVDRLVPLLGARAPAHGWRYSRRQIWRLHQGLFRHDMRSALRTGSVREFVEACRRWRGPPSDCRWTPPSSARSGARRG